MPDKPLSPIAPGAPFAPDAPIAPDAPDAYLLSLPCPVPEDIQHAADAGDVACAVDMIDHRLLADIPPMLRRRLTAERAFLLRRARDYPLTRADLCAQLQAEAPDFAPSELDAFMRRGLLDFVRVGDETRFHEDTAASLMKTQGALSDRALSPCPRQKPALDAVIWRVKRGGCAWRLRLRAATRWTADGCPPEDIVRLQLPLAARAMQQSPACDITASPALSALAPEGARQRTALLSGAYRADTPFTLAFSFDQRPRFIDPMDGAARRTVYPDALPVGARDLAEQPPHILFTPAVRALAAHLRGREGDPVRIARAFYDFITQKVTYAYMRPYLCIPGGAEYVAVNLRGDCGVQSLLFIAMCRLSGIPARWQSGLYTEPGAVGSHDWAQFYSARLGWLPVDCSFGGSAWREGARERWAFYFGNLDPWRMAANRAYYAPFDIPRRFARFDPYDNQRGEAELSGRALSQGEDFRTKWELLSWEEIKP